MGITGQWQGNYQQPDVTPKPQNPQVASYPIGGNPMSITGP